MSGKQRKVVHNLEVLPGLGLVLYSRNLPFRGGASRLVVTVTDQQEYGLHVTRGDGYSLCRTPALMDLFGAITVADYMFLALSKHQSCGGRLFGQPLEGLLPAQYFLLMAQCLEARMQLSIPGERSYPYSTQELIDLLSRDTLILVMREAYARLSPAADAYVHTVFPMQAG